MVVASNTVVTSAGVAYVGKSTTLVLESSNVFDIDFEAVEMTDVVDGVGLLFVFVVINSVVIVVVVEDNVDKFVDIPGVVKVDILDGVGNGFFFFCFCFFLVTNNLFNFLKKMRNINNTLKIVKKTIHLLLAGASLDIEFRPKH